MHMEDLFQDGRRVGLWNEIFERGSTDYRALFSKYRSTTDFPGCLLYHQLLTEYPNLKVILNYRDPDQWYSSMLHTVYPAAMKIDTNHAELEQRATTSPPFRQVVAGLRLVYTHLLQGYFAGNFVDEEATKQRYRRHYDRVRKTVPEQQLLQYDLRQGWEPLCAFLNVPVPTQPFPHKNTRTTFEAQIGNMLNTGSKPRIS
jgi:hypothetical protein